MKSEGSLFRCLAFVSVSAMALLWAYQWGKAHGRTTALSALPQPHARLALAEGQTILAVSDTTHAVRFYLGDEALGDNEAA